MKRMVKIFVLLVSMGYLSACGNNTESNNSGHDQSDNPDLYKELPDNSGIDSIRMDTLNTDSVIPPTPMNPQ